MEFPARSTSAMMLYMNIPCTNYTVYTSLGRPPTTHKRKGKGFATEALLFYGEGRGGWRQWPAVSSDRFDPSGGSVDGPRKRHFVQGCEGKEPVPDDDRVLQKVRICMQGLAAKRRSSKPPAEHHDAHSNTVFIDLITIRTNNDTSAISVAFYFSLEEDALLHFNL